MPDREKVINQIEVDIQRAERTGEMLVYVGRKTAKDALVLLKEQEPAVPAEIEGGGSTWWYVCGECHTAIDSRDKYCRECGRKVYWL